MTVVAGADAGNIRLLTQQPQRLKTARFIEHLQTPAAIIGGINAPIPIHSHTADIIEHPLPQPFLTKTEHQAHRRSRIDPLPEGKQGRAGSGQAQKKRDNRHQQNEKREGKAAATGGGTNRARGSLGGIVAGDAGRAQRRQRRLNRQLTLTTPQHLHGFGRACLANVKRLAVEAYRLLLVARLEQRHDAGQRRRLIVGRGWRHGLAALNLLHGDLRFRQPHVKCLSVRLDRFDFAPARQVGAHVAQHGVGIRRRHDGRPAKSGALALRQLLYGGFGLRQPHVEGFPIQFDGGDFFVAANQGRDFAHGGNHVAHFRGRGSAHVRAQFLGDNDGTVAIGTAHDNACAVVVEGCLAGRAVECLRHSILSWYGALYRRRYSPPAQGITIVSNRYDARQLDHRCSRGG